MLLKTTFIVLLFHTFLFCVTSDAQAIPDPNFIDEIRSEIVNGPDGTKPMGVIVSEFIKTEGSSLEDKSLAMALRKQEALPILLQELDTGTPYDKRKVTKFLRMARWNETVPKLLEIATSDQEHELSRIAALHTLGSIGNKSIAQSLVPLLKKDNRGSTEKRIIIATLARLKYRPAISSIEPFINHENPLVRIFALRALAELGQSVDKKILFSFLESEDYVIRQETCGALGVIGGYDAIIKLQSMAQNDWHEAVRDAAQMALYEIEARGLKHAQQCTFYEQMALNSDKKISNWAIQKLAHECGENGKEMLRKLARHDTSQGRKSAVYLILSNESYNQQ